jgi:hypothetical protein
VLLPKGFGMKNKSKPFICSVYYYLHGGEIFKNGEYRKKPGWIGGSD